VAAYQDLLEALRQASQAVAGTADPADKDRLAAQLAALSRFEALVEAGLPVLTSAETESVAKELRALMLSNGLNLKWTRMRAQLARIGAPRVAPPAPRVARLDLVS